MMNVVHILLLAICSLFVGKNENTLSLVVLSRFKIIAQKKNCVDFKKFLRKMEENTVW